MAEKSLSSTIYRKSGWVSIYMVAVALSLTTMGLVMLFSAGAVKGAEQLLFKQIIWLGLSLIIGIYAAFINLEWLRGNGWWIWGCLLYTSDAADED